jgi:hypothetical protein
VLGRLGVWAAAEAGVSGGGERSDGGCIAGGEGEGGGDASVAVAAAAIGGRGLGVEGILPAGRGPELGFWRRV